MFRLSLLLLICLAPSSVIGAEGATPSKDLTLILGNVRAAGATDPSLAELVGQSSASFEHRKSFPGDTVSVDVAPQRGSGKKQPHIQGDWLALDLSQELSKLGFSKEKQPQRIFFEWFPSCRLQFQPLLLPAIKKAFVELAPGGELIIENMPYVVSLRGTIYEAMTGVPDSDFFGKILSKLPNKLEECYPGILSHRWQLLDPFTLHISGRERVDLQQHLQVRMLQFEGQEATTIFSDKQTNVRAADQAIHELSTIFKKKESEIVAALSKVITTVEKEKDKLRIMFEYLYHLHARKRIISTTLTDIGFEVDEEASFQFFPENPYNKRKHAWLIKVHKPK